VKITADTTSVTADATVPTADESTIGFLGDLADLWIGVGVDLFESPGVIDEAQLRRFISASGYPVEVDQFPTGQVLLTGGASTFGTNLGSGGPFAVTGALTDGALVPSPPLPPYFPYSGPPYIARSVRFDGATYLKCDALAAPPGATNWATSFWINTTDSDAALWTVDPLGDRHNYVFWVGPSSEFASDYKRSTIEFGVGDGLITAERFSTATMLSPWTHVFLAVDVLSGYMATYINGQRISLNIFGTRFTPAINGLPFYVGADLVVDQYVSDGAGDYFSGLMADLWISFGVEDNLFDSDGNVPLLLLNKFISQAGYPMDPRGFPPAQVLLTGNEIDFRLNRGNGGAFTVHGTLTDGDPVPPQPPATFFYPGDRHIRRDGEKYASALMSLLPRGQAWPTDPESVLVRAVTGLALYYGFVDSRAADLLERESDPRITLELLPDWERAWGLPDPCFAAPITISERQRLLVMWMTLRGAQDRNFFTQLASFLGYRIRIREYAPWMFGVSEVGPTDDGTGYWRWEIGPPEMRFYWSAIVDDVSYIWWRYGRAEIGVDPHLRIGVPEDLQCMLNRWKPAHTDLIFDFTGVPFALGEMVSQAA
jgi:uncharacterized protein YmfQ (DUF2313 family)